MPAEVILIAAVTVDGFIARHNLEVTSWSKDLHLFKKQTMGHPVVMGSNTFKTLSGELGGREVLVVSRDQKPKDENIILQLKLLNGFNSSTVTFKLVSIKSFNPGIVAHPPDK